MKKIIILVSVALVALLGWYLFIRSFEFEVNFKAKTLPGDVIQTLKIWDNNLPNVQTKNVDSLYRLTQRIDWNGRSYTYHWNFEIINDSLTQVKILISEPGNSITNKILVPFTDQQIEKDAAEIAKRFIDILQTHLKITDVDIAGVSNTEASFCVCRQLKTEQTRKAFGMMKDYGLLTSFIHDSGLKASGPPSVRVRKWNHTSGSLTVDFCFPIEKQDDLPESDSITYRAFEGEKALKAIYHGNYITSDRAWYELTSFAQKNNYEITGGPIEYFYNNPNLGGEDYRWKAEVFLPIK